MAVEKQKLVGRHRKVAFMKTEENVFSRMTGFTSLSEKKNPKEYNRQYVDEVSERSDVVGYATSYDYEFDRYTENPVHKQLATIADDEIVGADAQVDIVVVDLFEKTTGDACTARKRTYSVIPDTTGDGTDALVYKGSLKLASELTKGTCTSNDDWKTCTFKETSVG